MQCPECGYQLTPFDKDCPRCKAFASKGITSSKPEAVELNFDPAPNATPSTDSITAAESSPAPTAHRKGFSPIVIAIAVLIALLLGYGLFSTKHAQYVDSARAAAVEQQAASVERIKSEGVQQCTAGDQEGCTYAMGKLRDANDYDNAEFLKLHIIVSLTLSAAVRMNDDGSKYKDNAGATAAEYEGYAKTLDDYSTQLSFENNDDYKIVEDGAEAARTLAEYGKSHSLGGRY